MHDVKLKNMSFGEPLIVVPKEDFGKLVRYGGKAKNLAIIAQNNFHIAPGVLLSDTVHNKLQLRGRRYLSLDDETYEELHSALRQLKIHDSPLIARSSAGIEDGAEHSFAGMFKTIRNIRFEEIERAINDIYSSVFNPMLETYSRLRKISIQNIRIAVLIQEFIKTDISGVIFTRDPIFKNNEKILIDYVLGDPEGIVSGTKTPNSITLSRQYLNNLDDTLDNYVLQQNLPGSNSKILSKAIKEALRGEELFQYPVDVEWGAKDNQLYIFQIRPITT